MATVHALAVQPDGSFAISVRPDSWIASRGSIAAATPEAIAVPSGAKRAVFGATGNFCVRYNASLAGPAASFGDVTDGTGCEINPTTRHLTGVAEISICAAVDGLAVSVMFFT